jgi:phage terminase small subunit
VAINSSSKAKQDALKKQAAAEEPKRKKGLTQQQLRFCEFYLQGMPAGRAYMQAGYSPKNLNNARVNASQLLTKPSVREYIEEQRRQIKKTFELNRGMLIENLLNIALGNVVEEQPVARFVGQGVQEIKIIKKATNPRDRAKATEILLRLISEEGETGLQGVANTSPIAEFSKQVKKNANTDSEIDTLGTEAEDLEETIDSEVPE